MMQFFDGAVTLVKCSGRESEDRAVTSPPELVSLREIPLIN